MPTIVETEVFTLDELVALGDERAVERALDWMYQAWADIAVEYTTDAIDNALDALCGSGPRLNGLRTGPITWTEWDAYRNYVTLEASFTPDDLRTAETDVAPLPHADLIRRVEVGRYGLDVWPEDEDLTPEQVRDVQDWWDALVSAMTDVLRQEYEYLTGREYLLDAARANEYTFTAEGKRFG